MGFEDNYNIYINLFYISNILPILPQIRIRDKKGRFISFSDKNSSNSDKPLPKNIMDPLIGNMLGDGHLRFTHKDKEGKVRG